MPRWLEALIVAVAVLCALVTILAAFAGRCDSPTVIPGRVTVTTCHPDTAPPGSRGG